MAVGDEEARAKEVRDLSADFRRRQFAEPNPALQRVGGVATSTTATATADAAAAAAVFPPDKLQRLDSVVLHFDLDCFYAQVEELLDPSLANRPVAVTQKYLVVTCNYIARQSRVTKLMGIKRAKALCPELVLRNGEDLTPYREYAASAESVLTRFGVVEKLGLDEFYVDVSALVTERLAGGYIPTEYQGHVFSGEGAVVGGERVAAETRFRPQDLRSATSGAERTPLDLEAATEEEVRLATGSQIAAEARAALREARGLTASCGISVNKLISKLCGGLHKPNGQTTLLFARDAEAFMRSLPVRVIKGIGAQTEERLRRLGVATCHDLRSQRVADIAGKVTNGNVDLAKKFHRAAWGIDLDEVVCKGPPKRVSVEDSFKGLSGFEAAAEMLRDVLIPDLMRRLAGDRQSFGRRPKTLAVTFRTTALRQKKHFARKTVSCPFPSAMNDRTVWEAAMSLLRKGVGHEPFTLTLLNVGATNFTQAPRPSVFTMDDDAEALLHPQSKRAKIGGGDVLLPGGHISSSSTRLVSKHQARLQGRTSSSPPSRDTKATVAAVTPRSLSPQRPPLGQRSLPSSPFPPLPEGEASAAQRPGKASGIGLVDADVLKELPEDIRLEIESGLGLGAKGSQAKKERGNKPITSFFSRRAE